MTALGLFAGCGKPPQEVARVPSSETNELGVSQGAPVPPEPTPPAGADDGNAPPTQTSLQTRPVVVPPGADAEATLAQMTRELRRWIVRNQRKPNSYEEFASSARLDAPPPPVGKKYGLSKNMRVVLVNR